MLVSRPHALPASSRAERRRALLGLALVAAACSDTTHTVGRLSGEPRALAGGPRGAAEAGNAGAQSPGSAGSTPVNAPPTSSGATDASSPPAADAMTSVSIGQDAAVGCASSTLPAERRQLDLYLMVDSNITLPLIGAWNTTLTAISSYVEQDRAQGTGIGIDYFGFSCSTSEYSTPAVGVDALPDNTQAIQSSLRTVLPINVSPMLPALEGAIIYARSRANAYPETRQAVVLLTDGFSDLMCGSDSVSLTAAAAEGARGTPSIPSYVIALDVPDLASLFNPGARFDPLNLIAAAGMTGQARRIDVQDPQSVFVDTLLEVQVDAEPCDYRVPDRVRSDPDSMVLARDDPSMPAAGFQQFSSAADCGNGEGYFLDADGNWLTLCQELCASIKQSRVELIWYTDCE